MTSPSSRIVHDLRQPASPTSWQLETTVLEVLTQLEDIPADQEAEPQLLVLLADALDDAAERRDALCGAYLRRQAHVEALRQRAKDALEKVERSEKALHRFRAYILSLLDLRGVKQLQGTQYRLGWVQNPSQVEVDPGVDLAWQFCRHVPERYESDKAAIREALESGIVIPGARLVEGDRRVVIK